MGAVIMGLLVVLIGGLLYVRRKNLEFLHNKTYWAIGALVNILFLLFSRENILMYSTNHAIFILSNYDTAVIWES